MKERKTSTVSSSDSSEESSNEQVNRKDKNQSTDSSGAETNSIPSRVPQFQAKESKSSYHDVDPLVEFANQHPSLSKLEIDEQFTEDDDVFLAEIPENFDPNELLDVSINCEGVTKFKSNGVKYVMKSYFNVDEPLLVLTKGLDVIQPTYKLKLQEYIKSKSESENLVEEEFNATLPNMKVRHCLLGAEYEANVELGKVIKDKETSVKKVIKKMKQESVTNITFDSVGRSVKEKNKIEHEGTENDELIFKLLESEQFGIKSVDSKKKKNNVVLEIASNSAVEKKKKVKKAKNNFDDSVERKIGENTNFKESHFSEEDNFTYNNEKKHEKIVKDEHKKKEESKDDALVETAISWESLEKKKLKKEKKQSIQTTVADALDESDKDKNVRLGKEKKKKSKEQDNSESIFEILNSMSFEKEKKIKDESTEFIKEKHKKKKKNKGDTLVETAIASESLVKKEMKKEKKEKIQTTKEETLEESDKNRSVHCVKERKKKSKEQGNDEAIFEILNSMSFDKKKKTKEVKDEIEENCNYKQPSFRGEDNVNLDTSYGLEKSEECVKEKRKKKKKDKDDALLETAMNSESLEKKKTKKEKKQNIQTTLENTLGENDGGAQRVKEEKEKTKDELIFEILNSTSFGKKKTKEGRTSSHGNVEDKIENSFNLNDNSKLDKSNEFVKQKGKKGKGKDDTSIETAINSEGLEKKKRKRSIQTTSFEERDEASRSVQLKEKKNKAMDKDNDESVLEILNSVSFEKKKRKKTERKNNVDTLNNSLGESFIKPSNESDANSNSDINSSSKNTGRKNRVKEKHQDKEKKIVVLNSTVLPNWRLPEFDPNISGIDDNKDSKCNESIKKTPSKRKRKLEEISETGLGSAEESADISKPKKKRRKKQTSSQDEDETSLIFNILDSVKSKLGFSQ